jgi:hypothetical protein
MFFLLSLVKLIYANDFKGPEIAICSCLTQTTMPLITAATSPGISLSLSSTQPLDPDAVLAVSCGTWYLSDKNSAL